MVNPEEEVEPKNNRRVEKMENINTKTRYNGVRNIGGNRYLTVEMVTIGN